MELDGFDLWWLEQKGDYIERARTIGSVTENKEYAKKLCSGINLYLKHKKNQPEEQPLNYMEEITIMGDGSRTTRRNIELFETEKNDPKAILTKMGLDPVQWKAKQIDMKRGLWNTAMKEGKETNHTYKCEVKAEPLIEELSLDILKEVFEAFEPPELEQIEYTPGDKCLEVNIPDAHIGLHAWADETGEANYDLDIAVETYKACILDMLAKVEQYGLDIERVWLPVAQDFFHIDNEDNTTTAGTTVDTDGRWKKVYKTGTDLLIWTIEQIRSALAPKYFEIFHIPGNHDEKFSYTAILHLFQTYNGVDGVYVDISETDRKYRQYGKVAVGFSHGREERKRIDDLMQEEEPELWGATRYREFHISDLHQDRLREPLGLKVRRLPSIAPSGAWGASKGYRALRMAEFFVWDKEKGLDTIINSIVEDG